jgi:hypothetical protein
MKKYWLFILLCTAVFSFSQEKQTRIKANALFLPLGMINIGVEREINHNISCKYIWDI